MLVFLYARGGWGWLLGFGLLVPWLRSLDAERALAGALLSAWGMAVAYTAAGFAWFGVAIGSYTQWGTGAGIGVLLLAAPLFQPQILAFALVRHWVGRSHGPLLRALAAAAAWVATEALVPRLLEDTLGYGLYPATLLRQAADLGGVAGLTLVLLLANEGLAEAWSRRRAGVAVVAWPLGLAAAVPVLLAGYGLAVLSAQPAAAGASLRVGLVQSNIVDYERLRRERGAGAVVREVLDTHFAMSFDAIERHGADAVLWSETVYPTTFGSPKSEAGAALDREIRETIAAAGVPFVFGTYDRDGAGEYNAAAIVGPQGPVGVYRKVRPFPLTEHVPPWLDGPLLRRWLPWTGHWQPGADVRVFPLRLRDGREVPVLPLVCLDDLDPALAVQGARLGAQAIVTLSNDAWFDAQGARLHQAAAAFRSIETRLPQFRVTTDGHSALIDATGAVQAGSAKGERMLVVGALPVRDPQPTLVVAWGDWVGPAAALFLLLALLWTLLRRWDRAREAARPRAAPAAPLPARVALLTPGARLVAGLLRTFARASLLWMAADFLLGGGAWQADTAWQLRTFAVFFLAPEAAAWSVLRAFAGRASLEQGSLVLARGSQRLALALRDVAGLQPWRLPVPGAGASVRLASGARWRWGLAHPDPWGLAHALAAAGAGAAQQPAPSALARLGQARAAVRHGRLRHPVARFVLLPLVLAMPAFRLHQHIAFGGTFGQLHAAGWLPYLKAFAGWWASWAIAVVLVAAVVRTLVEALALAATWARPAAAFALRRWLERFALAALYLGLPGWLLLRLLAA